MPDVRVSRRRVLSVALAAPAILRATPDLPETEDNIEGPFYKAGAPWRNVLAEKTTSGVPLVVRGRVLDLTGKLLAGAVLDVWHADGEGRYDNEGYRLRGRFRTDASAIYELVTVMPRFYRVNERDIRPAHIHLKLSGEGVRDLTTQLYFEGDPYNSRDRHFRQSLALAPKEKGRVRYASYDFVLRTRV